MAVALARRQHQWLDYPMVTTGDAVKIRISVVNGRLRIFCPDCDHDWFHDPLCGDLGYGLYRGLTDAYFVAEAMWFHHLTGMACGCRECPID